MREQLRVLILAILIYFLISDIIELASYIPVSSLTAAPLLQHLIPVKLKLHQSVKFKGNEQQNKDYQSSDTSKKKILAQGTSSVGNSRHLLGKTVVEKIPKARTRGNEQKGLSTKEAEEVLRLRQEWLKSMQDHCLPKLVCELHASLTGENSLSDIEVGILNAIKDTSLGTSAAVVSKYHFAAHMGQLLAGVEGNGCHNFYPSCPIAGTQVLQILKKVKLK